MRSRYKRKKKEQEQEEEKKKMRRSNAMPEDEQKTTHCNAMRACEMNKNARRRRKTNKTKTNIIISSCPKSISLSIDHPQPWRLWDLSLCPAEGLREAALCCPCAYRRACRPCIWPCRSWKKAKVLVNISSYSQTKQDPSRKTTHQLLPAIDIPRSAAFLYNVAAFFISFLQPMPCV